MKTTDNKTKNLPEGFCLAKWYQVTVDLVRGHTHSCHHPDRHKIPLDEIAKTPMALHNTHFKMLQRKKMLNRERPEECHYCWSIEDLPKGHDEEFISDRFIKSYDDWAIDKLEETLSLPWDSLIAPTYLEVVLSAECNLNCAYCVGDISSSIRREMLKYGPYPVKSDKRRFPSDTFYKPEENPYIKAFWEFLPMVLKDLKVLRLTGGEPLLTKDTFKIMDFLELNPNPNLELAINTNLVYPQQLCEKLLSSIKVLMAKKCIKKFTLFLSIDSFGKQATYIRHGMDLNLFLINFELIRSSYPDIEIVIMCTYNVLAVFNFSGLLKWIEEQKKINSKIYLDTSYLTSPPFLRANIIDQGNEHFVLDSLKMMKNSPYFSKYETKKFERVVRWIQSSYHDPNEKIIYQSDFYAFIKEYDKRFKLNFLDVFPEATRFYQICRKSYILGNVS